MASITIEGVAKVIADLQDVPAGAGRAAIRALNRAIASARTVMVREIARDVGLKSRDVRDALVMRKATATQPEASLGATLKRIPLIDFKATGPEPSRGRGRGVSYKLQGGRTRIPSAFIATMSSGHRGVFERAGASLKKSPGAWSKNLPIVELRGPSLGHVFAKYRQLGLAKAQEAFVTNFDHGLAFSTGALGATEDTSAGTD